MRKWGIPASLFAALVVLCSAPAASAIIGGTAVERPPSWMTAIYLDGDFLCGGSLVGRKEVLTATHCVSGLQPDQLAVAFGRRGVEGVPASDRRPIARITTGPGDVSILSMRRRIGNRPVKIVGRRQREAWAPGVRGRVMGYGARWVLGSGGVPLHQVRVQIRADELCARGLAGYDAELEFCAGEDLGGKDACSGDSGGPLVVRGPRGGELLAGVVSGGFLCALPTQYGLYSRLGGRAIRSWLTQALQRAD